MQPSQNPHTLVRLSRAPKLVQRISDERPDASTIYRWTKRGLRGVRLKSSFCGGYRCTCEAWLREFFDAVTRAADGNDSATIGPTNATKSYDDRQNDAERKLAAAGV
jgi:hypothetical protein